MKIQETRSGASPQVLVAATDCEIGIERLRTEIAWDEHGLAGFLGLGEKVREREVRLLDDTALGVLATTNVAAALEILKSITGNDDVVMKCGPSVGDIFTGTLGAAASTTFPLFVLDNVVEYSRAYNDNSLSDEQALFTGDILSTAYMAAENCNIQPGDIIAVAGNGQGPAPDGMLTDADITAAPADPPLPASSRGAFHDRNPCPAGTCG